MTDAPNDQKFAELLIIVAEALADEPAAGAVKVNKILWYAENAHMRATGTSITGTEYQRLHAGPAPRRLRPVRADLIQRGEVRLQREAFQGVVQHRLVALRPGRWEVFSETEQTAIRETLAELRSQTGTDLMKRSHAEDAWQLYEEGETIPLVWAFASGNPPGPRALKRAEELALRYGLG